MNIDMHSKEILNLINSVYNELASTIYPIKKISKISNDPRVKLESILKIIKEIFIDKNKDSKTDLVIKSAIFNANKKAKEIINNTQIFKDTGFTVIVGIGDKNKAETSDDGIYIFARFRAKDYKVFYENFYEKLN